MIDQRLTLWSAGCAGTRTSGAEGGGEQTTARERGIAARLRPYNKEIGRRTDVVGIFPNDAAVIRLAGALLSEQNDEWLVQRRYLSVESMALILSAGWSGDPSLEQQQQPRRSPNSPAA